jgi:hypothetical protein
MPSNVIHASRQASQSLDGTVLRTAGEGTGASGGNSAIDKFKMWDERDRSEVINVKEEIKYQGLENNQQEESTTHIPHEACRSA